MRGGDNTVECIGKILQVLGTVGIGATTDKTAGTQFFTHVAALQMILDVLRSIERAPWIDRHTGMPEDFGSEWDVCGYDQVTGLQTRQNFVVRHVEARRHLQRRHIT